MAPDNGQFGRTFPTITTLLLGCVALALTIGAGCGRGKRADEIAASRQALTEPEWAAGVQYNVGAQVRFQSEIWVARQAHESRAGLEPPGLYSLWHRPAPQQHPIPLWTDQTRYPRGFAVNHNGLLYEALTPPEHISQPDRAPSADTASVWRCASPGCGGSCQNKPSGTLCDGGDACVSAHCDGNGFCVGNVVATCSAPAERRRALLVVKETPAGPSFPDEPLRSKLASLGFEVEIKPGSASTAGDAASSDLIVISASVDRDSVAAKFRDVTAPVIALHPGVWVDMRLAGSGASDTGSTDVQNQITILTGAHPLAAGHTGNVTTVSPGSTFTWARALGSGAIKVASLVGEANRVAVFAYDLGATRVGGGASPGRRVGMYMSDLVPGRLNSTGDALFAAAVRWAAEKPALLVHGGNSIGSQDALLRDRLQGLGLPVSLASDEAPASSAHGKQVVVISESADSEELGRKYKDVPVPLVVLEGRSFEKLRMTGAGWGTNFGSSSGQQDLTIVTATHPLAAGLSGTVRVASTPRTFFWGKPTASAILVARMPGAEPGQYSIFGYEARSAMVNWAAPARRVGWFPNRDGMPSLTADGWKLFDAAVSWAAGRTERERLLCAGKTDGVVCGDREGVCRAGVCQVAFTAPERPTALTATAVGDRNVQLTWQDNSNREAGYRVFVARQLNRWIQIAELPPNATGFLDTGRQPNRKYAYSVVAFSRLGHSLQTITAVATARRDAICAGKSDGESCGDSDRCNGDERCQSGVCVTNPAPQCPNPDANTGGICDPEDGACVSLPRDYVKLEPAAAIAAGNIVRTSTFRSCGEALAGGAPLRLCTIDWDRNGEVDGYFDGAGFRVPFGRGGPTTCQNCDDGNSCTIDSCESGICVSRPLYCLGVEAPEACEDGECRPLGILELQEGECPEGEASEQLFGCVPEGRDDPFLGGISDTPGSCTAPFGGYCTPPGAESVCTCPYIGCADRCTTTPGRGLQTAKTRCGAECRCTGQACTEPEDPPQPPPPDGGPGGCTFECGTGGAGGEGGGPGGPPVGGTGGSSPDAGGTGGGPNPQISANVCLRVTEGSFGHGGLDDELLDQARKVSRLPTDTDKKPADEVLVSGLPRARGRSKSTEIATRARPGGNVRTVDGRDIEARTATGVNRKANQPDEMARTTDPITVLDGELVITEEDLTFPGTAVPFSLVRSYRSRNARKSQLGHGWDHSYNQLLEVEDGEGAITYFTGFATSIRFTRGETTGTRTSYGAPEGVAIQLYRDPSDAALPFVMTDRAGTRRKFDPDGLLRSITDVNGVGLALSWQTDPHHDPGDPRSPRFRLARVVLDPEAPAATRREVVFSYVPAGQPSAGQLQTVSEARSTLSTSYTYHPTHDLKSATNQEGRREGYRYGTPHSGPVPDTAYIPGGSVESLCQDQCVKQLDLNTQCVDQCRSNCAADCKNACRGGMRDEDFRNEQLCDGGGPAGPSPLARCIRGHCGICNDPQKNTVREQICLPLQPGIEGRCAIGCAETPEAPPSCANDCKNCLLGEGAPNNVGTCAGAASTKLGEPCRRGEFALNCVNDCEETCQRTGSCTNNCTTACNRIPALIPPSVLFAGCTAACVAANNEATGQRPRYGYPQDVDHNLETVLDEDDETKVMLKMTYGRDVFSPEFDGVTLQQMGDKTPGAAERTWYEAKLQLFDESMLSPRPSFPFICSGADQDPKTVEAVSARHSRLTDAYGSVWEYRFDSHGNKLVEKNLGTGAELFFNFDKENRLVAMQLPSRARVCMVYNGHDLEKVVEHPAPMAVGASLNPLKIETTMQYRHFPDGVARLDLLTKTGGQISVTDPEYDARGNVISVKDPGGRLTRFPEDSYLNGVPTRQVLPDETQIVLGYTRGALSQRSIVDPVSGTTTQTITPDEAGRPLDGVGSLGERTHWTWVAGRLESVTVSNRQATLTGADGPFVPHTNSFGYQNGRMISTSDDSAIITVGRDIVGNVRRVETAPAPGRSGPAQVTCVQHGPDGRRLAVKTPHGNIFRFRHDGEGRLNEIVVNDAADVADSARIFGSACDQPLRADQPRITGQLLFMAYDADGRPHVVHRDGKHEAQVLLYDGYGRPVMLTDERGARVHRFFDDESRLLWEAAYDVDTGGTFAMPSVPTSPGLLSLQRLSYYPEGRLQSRTVSHFKRAEDGTAVDRGLLNWSYVYDDRLRRVQITGPRETVTQHFDGHGRLVSSSSPAAGTSTIAYDMANREIRTSHPHAQRSLDSRTTLTTWGATSQVFRGSGESQVRAFEYDERKRPREELGEGDGLIETLYDAFGRVETSRQSTAGRAPISETTLGWDREDLLASVTSASLRGSPAVTRYTRDSLGRVVSVVRPGADAPTGRYGYQGVSGLVRREARPGGGFIIYGYDNGDLPNSLLSGTLSPPLEAGENLFSDVDNGQGRFSSQFGRSFSHDGLGRLTSATKARFRASDPGPASVTTTMEWDSLGQLVRETSGHLTGAAATIAVTDEAFATSTTWNLAGVANVTRTWDPLRRLANVAVSSEGAPVASVGLIYGQAGPPTTRTGGGLTATSSFDELGRLVGLTYSGARSGGWSWIKPLDGLARAGTFAINNQVPRTSIFELDDLGRLVSEDNGIPDFEPSDIGNIGTLTPSATANQSSAQWFQASNTRQELPRQYELDGRHNWQTRTIGQDPAVSFGPDARDLYQGTAVGARYDDDDNLTEHAGQIFVYDATGNLLSARGAYGQKQYAYDALERLIQEDHTPAGAPGADITKFGYLGDQRVTRQRPDGVLEVMVEGDGLDEHLVRVVKASGSVASPLYYHQDQMGSVAMVTNAAGEVVEQYAYTAYGDQQIFTGTNVPRANSDVDVGNVWGYQGHQVDTHTGLVQMRARWYHPALGRFTSPDPLGLLGGNNLLAFGFSAPTKYSDPFGLAAKIPNQPSQTDMAFWTKEILSGTNVFQAGIPLDVVQAITQRYGGLGSDHIAIYYVTKFGIGMGRSVVGQVRGLADISTSGGQARAAFGLYMLSTDAGTRQQLLNDVKGFIDRVQSLDPEALGMVTGEVATLAIAPAKAAQAGRVGRVADGLADVGRAGRRAASAAADVTRGLNSSSAFMSIERASPELLDAIGRRRTVQIVEAGSEELRYLDFIGAEANVGGETMKHILLRSNPGKAAVLEEFLHGTQWRNGIIQRLGTSGAETHVKDFMIRHQRLLGLSDEDIVILQQLRDAGL